MCKRKTNKGVKRMVGLKALLRTAAPGTKVHIYSYADEKLIEYGTALSFLTMLETEKTDAVAEHFTCGAGRINIHLQKPKEQ
jgi:hypothetical protein